MSDIGGSNRHDETYIGQGFLASNGASVKIGDQHFYGHEPRSNQRKSLLDLLWFPQIGSRGGAIDCEHDGTCTWLLNTPEYASWRADVCSESRDRLIWIKGKAGAGKSTMMKFAVKESRKMLKKELVLAHFFNARGTAIEHSTEGMYRTLLHWLLEELPNQRRREFELTQEHLFYGHHDEVRIWKIPELVGMLEAALEVLVDRPVTLYIDALDECAEEEIRDMLKVFRKAVRLGWTSGREVRVCFASRPYPYITFPDATFLDFSTQEDHLNDLHQYITDELQLGTSSQAEGIRQNVLEKAQGSFMWVVLVVRILNTEYDSGHMDRLSKRLYEVPSGLSDLYSHILERYPGDRDALLICCQWMIFGEGSSYSYHAPGYMLQQLWWIVRLRVDGDEQVTRCLYDTISHGDMERYIVNISKGLVEIRNYYQPQFLHESVREFILRSKDVWQLCGARDSETFEALSHGAIRDCLLTVLVSQRIAFVKATAQKTPPALIHKMWSAHQEGKLAYPLALLAATTTFCHTIQGQMLGIDQTAFLKELNRRGGPHLLDPYHVFSESSIKAPVRVLYNIAGFLMAAETGQTTGSMQLRYGQPAWSQGRLPELTDNHDQSHLLVMSGEGICSYDFAIRHVVGIYLAIRPRTPRLQAILRYLDCYWHILRFGGPRGSHPLLLYTASRLPNLASFLLLAQVNDDELLSPYIPTLESIFDEAALKRRSSRNRVGWEQDWAHDFSGFLKTLHLFLHQGLRSPAMNFGYHEIWQWIELGNFEHALSDTIRALYKEPQHMIKELVRIRCAP